MDYFDLGFGKIFGSLASSLTYTSFFASWKYSTRHTCVVYILHYTKSSEYATLSYMVLDATRVFLAEFIRFL